MVEHNLYYDFCRDCPYSGGMGGMGVDGVSMNGVYGLSGSSVAVALDITNSDDKAVVTIFVAQYSSAGKMKGVKMFSYTGTGELIEDNLFTHADGDTYRAFMVKPTVWTPLCKADLSAPKG